MYKQNHYGYEIDAVKLAGAFDGLYYADIDGKIDFEIKPSKYAAIVIKRIKRVYAIYH
jgi:hypothetical protein